ncbi:MAG TPA: tetratricopeptide repeat protein [Pyrinomonadaceae bacterium]
MSVRTSHPSGPNLQRLLPRLLPLTALVAVSLLLTADALAQGTGIGAHRSGDVGTGGNFSIQGHIISPTGRLPETRVRISVSSSNSGTRTAVAGADGVFLISSLEPGPYDVTIDAGREFEVEREKVYLGGSTHMSTLPVYLRLKPEANPALAGVPRPAVDLFVKAQEAARKGDSAKAETLLGEAVAQHPQFGLAHNELGLMHMRAGRLDKALEAYAAAATTLPEDPFVQLNYGTALTQKKDFAEAEKQLRRALKKLGKSATGHMYLGVALIGLKNIDEAERELQQAAKLGGDQMGAAHKYLGGIYWARRDYKKAADELETYLKLSPRAPDAEQVRGTIKDLRTKS